MTKDEKKFIKKVVDWDVLVQRGAAEVKENFNVNSEVDIDECTIRLSCDNVNESLNLLAAKEYLENELGEEFITVIF